MIAVATYIQQKCKQKPITHERSSLIRQQITRNGNALNGVDPIGLTEIKNTPMTDSLTVVMPHYTSATKESPMVFA